MLDTHTPVHPAVAITKLDVVVGVEDSYIDRHRASGTAVCPEDVRAPSEVGVDIAGREAAAELVTELLGESKIEGKLVGTEVSDGRPVDVREGDVAEREVPEGHADSLALVELAGAAEISQ